jgi:hypothetical protein
MLTFDQILLVMSVFELSVSIECDGIHATAIEIAERLCNGTDIDAQAIINPMYISGPMFADIINVLQAYA